MFLMSWERQLSEKQVIEITGLSRSTIRRREDEGIFPKRRSSGGRRVFWLEKTDIDAYQARCKPGAFDSTGLNLAANKDLEETTIAIANASEVVASSEAVKPVDS